MNTTTHTKRGFALPAAIGGLVIVGILATGGFYMARQEVRVGVASRHASWRSTWPNRRPTTC